MIVSLESAGAASRALAELARTEAERYRPRTHERQSAAVLWAALVTTPTPDAARAVPAVRWRDRTLQTPTHDAHARERQSGRIAFDTRLNTGRSAARQRTACHGVSHVDDRLDLFSLPHGP